MMAEGYRLAWPFVGTGCAFCLLLHLLVSGKYQVAVTSLVESCSMALRCYPFYPAAIEDEAAFQKRSTTCAGKSVIVRQVHQQLLQQQKEQ